MNTHRLWLGVVFVGAVMPGIARAQHDAHQAGAPQGSIEAGQCSRAQPVVDNIVAAAMSRLESARQSNNPAELRAAVDHLEAALRDIRAQLAPCAAAKAPAADPHAGQAMPGMQPPAAAPAPANQASPAAPDPHAGHAMPATPAAPRSAPTTKAAPGKARSQSPTDPHAAHAMPGGGAAKSAPPPKPAPTRAERPQPADPHAAHASAESLEKQMDPVSGLMVDPSTSPKTTYQGQTYYFSSEQTRKEFLENPSKFAKKPKR